MIAVVRFLTFVLGCLFIVGGVAGGFGYFIYSTVAAIFEVIQMFKSEVVEFWAVFWLCVMWCTREFIAAIIAMFGFLVGMFFIKVSDA